MLLITIITYLLNIGDLVFTLRLSKEYGNEIEGNPIGKMLMNNTLATVLVKVFMAIPMFGLYFLRRFAFCRVCVFVLFGIYVILTLYHIFIIIYLKYHKKKYDL